MLTGFNRLLILSSAALLCACAPYAPDSEKAGLCNELNSKIIFNGSTSNIRQAEIQESQAPLEQSNYDKKCS
jgi:hypothetical protein